MIYISMLRGVNVSGKNRIPMDALKQAYEDLGFADVRTYVQSGNVIFSTPEELTGLARRIEAQIQVVFGIDVPVILRTPLDLRRMLDANPFLPKYEEQAEFLHVTFLSERPDESNLEKLPIVPQEGDVFAVGEKEVYLYCPGGYGKTKYTNTFFEKKLDVPATTRNWKTVNALAGMAAVSSS